MRIVIKQTNNKRCNKKYIDYTIYLKRYDFNIFFCFLRGIVYDWFRVNYKFIYVYCLYADNTAFGGKKVYFICA